MDHEINRKTICRECGREIPGVYLSFGDKWVCPSCTKDKGDVLYSEHGTKVKVDTFKAGSSFDRRIAESHLKLNCIYTVDKISIGRSYTDVWLVEVPDCSFNSVFFERVK